MLKLRCLVFDVARLRALIKRYEWVLSFFRQWKTYFNYVCCRCLILFNYFHGIHFLSVLNSGVDQERIIFEGLYNIKCWNSLKTTKFTWKLPPLYLKMNFIAKYSLFSFKNVYGKTSKFTSRLNIYFAGFQRNFYFISKNNINSTKRISLHNSQAFPCFLFN